MRHSLAPRPADLPTLLEHWVAAGVITPEQAARMRADVGPAGPSAPTMPAASPETDHRQASLAIEALGYLGSVLIVVASLLLASEYWADLSTVGQLIVVGGAAVALLLAGFAVPERLGPAGTRMHAVLWLGATVATAGFLGLFGHEVLGWYGEDLALLVFVGATALAAALWWRLPTGLQQAAVVAGLTGAAGAAAAEFGAREDQCPDWPCGVSARSGSCWVGVALCGRVGPRCCSVGSG